MSGKLSHRGSLFGLGGKSWMGGRASVVCGIGAGVAGTLEALLARSGAGTSGAP